MPSPAKELQQPWSLNLSKDDTTAIKAVAMFMIVAHNFLHQVTPTPEENEFFFHSAEGIWEVLVIAANLPAETLHAVIAFIGHYGVQLFVFLSGFGLTKKFLSLSQEDCETFPNLNSKAIIAPNLREKGKDRKNKDVREVRRAGCAATLQMASTLAAGQIIKMLKLITVAAPVVILYRTLVLQDSLQDVLREFVYFITFTNNLNPIPDAIWGFVSIWWFFAVIIQLYILYPVLLTGMRYRPTLTLTAVLTALGIAAVFYDHPELVNESFILQLFATPLTHSTVFTLGIAFALGKTLDRNWITLFATVLLFAQFLPILFSVSFMSLTICTLYVYDNWGRRLAYMKPVLWFGNISMFVFVLHGVLRRPWIPMLNNLQEGFWAASKTTCATLTLGSFALWFVWVLFASWWLSWFYKTVMPR